MKLEDHLPSIHSMGNLIFDPVWSINKHVSTNCELLHIISGSVSLVINRRRIKASAGDTLLIPSRTLHRDEFDFDEGLKVFMIQFQWSCEKDFFSRLSCSSLIRLSKPRKESIANLIQQFRSDFTEVDKRHDFILRIRLSEIFMRILALSEKEKKMKGNDEIMQADMQNRDWIVKKVKSYLEENYSRPLSLEEISRHASVSPFHLCRIFSHENDFTIFEYLTHIRMTRARCLLDDGKLSVSETAFAVGFSNSNYFSKVFHRIFGVPPKRMRRKNHLFRRS